MLIDLGIDPATTAAPFADSALADIEDMIHLPLPADYVEHLRKHNGGKPRRRYFRVGRNEKVIERFLCIVADYKKDPNGEFDLGVVWSDVADRMEDRLVPFASLFAGDYLCFDYQSSKANPKVVVWDHELSRVGRVTQHAVADSFEEFLSLLTDKPAE